MKGFFLLGLLHSLDSLGEAKFFPQISLIFSQIGADPYAQIFKFSNPSASSASAAGIHFFPQISLIPQIFISQSPPPVPTHHPHGIHRAPTGFHTALLPVDSLWTACRRRRWYGKRPIVKVEEELEFFKIG